MISHSERDALAADIQAIWPRVESGEASLEDVRALALRVFDRLGAVSGLDRWEKHHFIWVLKGLAFHRENPDAGLHTALHGIEQSIAPAAEREIPQDVTLDQLDENDLRELVAAA